MTEMRNWHIYKSDGRYLGQSVAFASKVAFCQYMSLFGEPIGENDVVLDTVDENPERMTYGSEQFMVLSQD